MLSPPKPTMQNGPSGPAPQGAPTPKSFSIVDLKQYFHVVVKRIWLVALCFIISLAITVVTLVKQEPIYRAQVKLLLHSGLNLPRTLLQDEIRPLGDYIGTQIQILTSKDMHSRARARMNRPSHEVGRNITGTSVYPVGKTAFLYIQVTSRDPHVGAEYANALAESYLDFKADERMDTSQATVISLTQQANRLRQALEKAEREKLAFERDNSVIAIRQRGNIAADIIARLSGEAAIYRMNRMLLEAEQPLIADASSETVLQALAPPMLSSYGPGSISIASFGGPTNSRPSVTTGTEGLVERGVVSQRSWVVLNRQKTRLQAKLEATRETLRDAHPKVQRMVAELERLDGEIELELQFALREFYTKLDALRIKEQASRRVELEWEDEALEVDRKSREFSHYEREVGRLQGLYDLVFSRLKEVDIAMGTDPESIRIMERAVPAGHPMSPRKVQNIFMAALIGLGVGLALVFGLEYIDDSLKYPEEVTGMLGLNFFGIIPAANWDPDDLRSHLLSNLDDKSGLAEAYRNVRSSLLFSGGGQNAQTLVVTSAVPREGKTTTTLNLGVSLAQAGERVLLVDGDLRRGALHKFFGLEGGRGMADILAGRAKPEAVVQRTQMHNIDLVATGAFPPNPAELLMRTEAGAFIEYARQTYDRVLIDCPPVMAVTDAGILASMVEGVVFVVWAGQTSKKLAHLAVQQLREKGANILGCVLNNLEFGRVGYYYYSTYYGYYDYNYYDSQVGRPS